MIPKRYLNFLREVSEGSEPVGGSQHACILVYKKNILCWGVNKKKTHPLQVKFGDPLKIYLHAEIDCIVKAVREYDEKLIKNSTMYLTRFGSEGTMVSAPCEGCQEAIDFYGISKVVHT